MPQKLLPQKDEILSAMKVAETSVEGAEYLFSRFKKILTEAKILDKSQDMLEVVKNFVDFVRFKLTAREQPWAGQIVKTTDFKNMQENIGYDAAKKLESLLNERQQQDIKLDIAISDSAQLLRGYSAAGKPLDAKTLEFFDKLFNAWLADKGIVSKDSILYEANEYGEIKTDLQGQQIRAQTDEIKQLISDKEVGFEKYLENKGIEISSQQHVYPDAKNEAKKQQEVQQALQAGGLDAQSKSTAEQPVVAETSAGVKAGG